MTVTVLTAAACAALAPLLGVHAAPAPGPAPVPLWPQGAPDARGASPADVPTLTYYVPERAASTRSAVVVLPGGGYAGQADHEGKPIAEWLNALGITAVVLHYRVAPGYHHPAPLRDAQRALRVVRSRAAELAVDPGRIGILGFSAGGHLAATASTRFDAGRADAADPVERVSCRPDVAILLYPVITLEGPYAHTGSRDNLLGPGAAPEMATELSAERQVTPRTPPTFLMHTLEDAGVPVENSLLFAAALRKAGVPYELHVYEKGAHGIGLGQPGLTASSWPERCADWLRMRGFVHRGRGPRDVEAG